MKMLEISKEKFEDFAKNYPYYNYYQTENYALVMKESGFDYNFIAYTDNDEKILAAGMFLTKKITRNYYYSYCPKGFIIDYNDSDLVRRFTNNLKKYYKRKNVILLKINPEISIATINSKNNFERKTNSNIDILEDLKKYGFKKRKETKPLQLIEPKLYGTINLKDYDITKLDKNIQYKIEKSENNGLEIELSDESKIDIIYNLIKYNDKKDINFYKNMLINFKKYNQADLLLVKVNYESYLINAKKKVEEEQIRNDELNESLKNDMSSDILSEKMESDRILEEYKKDVVYATQGLRKNEETYIAGALVIKFENKISIIALSKDENYNYLNQEYFLYNEIINMYKDEYEILDINAIADDFKEDSIYTEYNRLKLEFNPTINESIGEFDLVISEWKFKVVEKNNILSNEFSKKKDIDTK